MEVSPWHDLPYQTLLNTLNNFGGDSSLDVSWTNGPTTAAVEAIAKQHPSIAYDEASGEALLGGNRDVSGHRLSPLTSIRRPLKPSVTTGE